MALADPTGAPAPTRPTKPRGKHPIHRLAALQVKNLRTPGRYADGNGLYLEIDETGARRWLLRTVAHGKRRELGLGSALLVPLADARDKAARLRRVAREGGDPLVAHRRERQAIPTFRDAAKTLHEHHAERFRNKKHADQWWSSLKSIVFPHFGDRPVDTIEQRDVLAALTPVWNKTPETARRVKQRIRAVLHWAKASGCRHGDNPADGVELVLGRQTRAVQHHPALPYQQVPAFLETLRTAHAGLVPRLAFEFLILTATRTTEVRLARWDEFDREAQIWTIPAARMKAHVEHQVPLSNRCIEILKDAERLSSDSPYVFAGRFPTQPLSQMTFLMLLRRLKREDIVPHGFRSTFRDWAAERTTFPRAVVEAALAHTVKDTVEAAYLRTTYLEQRRELMATWAAFATATVANVVPIRA